MSVPASRNCDIRDWHKSTYSLFDLPIDRHSGTFSTGSWIDIVLLPPRYCYHRVESGSMANNRLVCRSLVRANCSDSNVWFVAPGSLLDERQSTTNYEEDLCQGLVSSLAANKNSLNIPRTGRSFVLYKFKNCKSEIKGDVKI